ncbi:MAG: MATE family efflux transporter [Spirochaetales bacterium]|nr:MATE family efflux transporter [Spirochaetales bacterium]
MNLKKIKESLPKTIIQFSLPAIIGMVLTSAIAIVDGLFMGNYIGKSAITAVNLGLPILYLFLAVGIMIGVGGVSSSLRMLGQREKKKSNRIFNQTIVTTVAALFLLSLLLMVSLDKISLLFDVDGLVRGYFKEYYYLMILVYPLMMVNTNLGMFVRGEGKPAIFMMVMALSLILNIVLDYCFVKVWDFGVAGIAQASILSIFVSSLLLFAFFLFRAKIFHFCRFHFSKKILADTVANGFSEFIGQGSLCLTMFALNFVILREGGVDGVAAFTVLGYASYLFTMVIIGLGQGTSPLVSFTHGAGEYGLGIKIRRIANTVTILLGVVILLSLDLASHEYSSLFVRSRSVQDMVTSGIPVFTLAFLFMGLNIITSFYFTSIGKAKESALIASSRGLVVLLIAIFLFPALWGMSGVWLIAPVTEFATVLLSLFFIFRHDRTMSLEPITS